MLLGFLIAFCVGLVKPPPQPISNPFIPATEVITSIAPSAIPPWEEPPKVLHTPPLVATLPEDEIDDISQRLRSLVVIGTLPSGGMPA